eukprot:1160721-Pelagomonas_calceolata.AAC.10
MNLGILQASQKKWRVDICFKWRFATRQETCLQAEPRRPIRVSAPWASPFIHFNASYLQVKRQAQQHPLLWPGYSTPLIHKNGITLPVRPDFHNPALAPQLNPSPGFGTPQPIARILLIPWFPHTWPLKDAYMRNVRASHALQCVRPPPNLHLTQPCVVLFDGVKFNMKIMRAKFDRTIGMNVWSIRGWPGEGPAEPIQACPDLPSSYNVSNK